jgi:hypothetical protein
MKKFLISILIIVTISALFATTATATPIENTAQWKAQISYFKQALDEFGATTPEQAVQLWVKGDQMRNGVFKYAAGSDKIKQWLIDKWGAPEKNFWIIGGSSPWLDAYEIVSQTKVSPTELRYGVKYFWMSSAGPSEPTLENLTVTKEKDSWRVSKVIPVTGPSNY